MTFLVTDTVDLPDHYIHYDNYGITLNEDASWMRFDDSLPLINVVSEDEY